MAPHGQDDLSFMVTGRLHGRARWTTFSGDASVVITAINTAERDRWMNGVRLRISSPQALQELAKSSVDDGAGDISVDSVTEEMKPLLIGDNVDAPSDLVDEVSSAHLAGPKEQVVSILPFRKAIGSRRSMLNSTHG